MSGMLNFNAVCGHLMSLILIQWVPERSSVIGKKTNVFLTIEEYLERGKGSNE